MAIRLSARVPYQAEQCPLCRQTHRLNTSLALQPPIEVITQFVAIALLSELLMMIPWRILPTAVEKESRV